MRPATMEGASMEQLELSLEFTPEPVAHATFFDPILGAIQAPANLYGE